MKVAVRILDALDDKRIPKSADMALLEFYAGPKPEGASLEEFVCAGLEKYFQQRTGAQWRRDLRKRIRMSHKTTA